MKASCFGAESLLNRCRKPSLSKWRATHYLSLYDGPDEDLDELFREAMIACFSACAQ